MFRGHRLLKKIQTGTTKSEFTNSDYKPLSLITNCRALKTCNEPSFHLVWPGGRGRGTAPAPAMPPPSLSNKVSLLASMPTETVFPSHYQLALAAISCSVYIAPNLLVLPICFTQWPQTAGLWVSLHQAYPLRFHPVVNTSQVSWMIRGSPVFT